MNGSCAGTATLAVETPGVARAHRAARSARSGSVIGPALRSTDDKVLATSQ